MVAKTEESTGSKTWNSPYPKIVAKARIYDGEAEITWGVDIPGKRGAGSARGQSPNFVENLIRAEKRARATVRRKILTANLDYLLTLTTRENILSFERAAFLFARFVRLLHKYLPDWQYVAVAERQTRGAYHWHVAIKGWQNLDLLRRCWREVCGEGNIDVQGPKGQVTNHQWKIIRLALYLTKYITKEIDFTDDGQPSVGRHRYRASLGIEETIEVRYFPISGGKNVVLAWLAEIAGRIGYQQTFNEGKAGWMCSWTYV